MTPNCGFVVLSEKSNVDQRDWMQSISPRMWLVYHTSSCSRTIVHFFFPTRYAFPHQGRTWFPSTARRTILDLYILLQSVGQKQSASLGTFRCETCFSSRGKSPGWFSDIEKYSLGLKERKPLFSLLQLFFATSHDTYGIFQRQHQHHRIFQIGAKRWIWSNFGVVRSTLYK